MWKDRLFQSVMAIAICGSVGLILWLSAQLWLNEPAPVALNETDTARLVERQLRPGTSMADVARWLKSHDFEMQEPPQLTDRISGKPAAEAAGLTAGVAARAWRCVPRTVPEGRPYRLYLFFDADNRVMASLAAPAPAATDPE